MAQACPGMALLAVEALFQLVKKLLQAERRGRLRVHPRSRGMKPAAQ